MTNDKVKELVDNLEVILMNTTFGVEDIEKSDVGTFYLSEIGLRKVIKSLSNADLALIEKDEILPGSLSEFTGFKWLNERGEHHLYPVIPLAEAIKGGLNDEPDTE